MKDTMPSWPQMLLISAFGTAAIACCYFLGRMRENWGPPAWALLALLALSGAGFALTVLMFYLRPQYGERAFPLLLAFLLGHFALVALLWRMGALG